MPTEIGSTSPSVILGDGSVITFINTKQKSNAYASVNYKYHQLNDVDVGYSLSLSATETKRVLFFYSGYHQSVFNNSSNFNSATGCPVPYVSYDVAGTTPGLQSAKFLYEVFFPQISRANGVNQMSFCTTVRDINAVEAGADFDPDLSYNILGDTSLNGDIDAIKAAYPRGAVVFCSAMLHWKHLKYSSEITSEIVGFVPFVRKVLILNYMLLSDYVFLAGGGGGGIGRHSHESNSNNACGFAYSVFAPGSSIKPISWV